MKIDIDFILMNDLPVLWWVTASLAYSWIILFSGLINSIYSLTIPDSLDWTSKGAITPVNRYENVSYSSAVVIVETIESLHAIATSQRIRGSIALVVDCCSSTGFTYDCIRQLGGICTYEDYPDQYGRCHSSSCIPFATFDRLDDLSGKNESSLLTSIQAATLMINVDASAHSFITYSGGIYQEKNCSQSEVNHALQLIGYGNAPTGEQYWIAKNSWGPDWGEKGFIRILRDENICGLTKQVYQPWTNGNPPTVAPVLVDNTTVEQTIYFTSTSETISFTSTVTTFIDATTSGMIKVSSTLSLFLWLHLISSLVV